ncbi:MAG: DUF3179 domain-containing protein [Chloroflexi bacterium]|nr:DUF3179 domain-containing protein [Chloroflexota bacterium]
MVDGRRLTFETTGLLDGAFRMKDRETGTIWTHLDGKAIAGPLEGQRLTMVPIPQTTWGRWKADYADTLVLDPDTPFQDRYVRPVQIGVYNPNEAIYGDDRLPSNTLVVGVEVEGVFKGYPLDELESAGGVVNDTLAGEPIVVIYDSAARTGVAYRRQFDGRTLEFHNVSEDGYEFRDRETGSLWDVHGRTAEGAYGDARLEFVPSFISEWYGWSAYHPETQLYGTE